MLPSQPHVVKGRFLVSPASLAATSSHSSPSGRPGPRIGNVVGACRHLDLHLALHCVRRVAEPVQHRRNQRNRVAKTSEGTPAQAGYSLLLGPVFLWEKKGTGGRAPLISPAFLGRVARRLPRPRAAVGTPRYPAVAPFVKPSQGCRRACPGPRSDATHGPQEGVVILVLEEDITASVATVDDVVTDAANRGSCGAWRRGRVSFPFKTPSWPVASMSPFIVSKICQRPKSKA